MQPESLLDDCAISDIEILLQCFEQRLSFFVKFLGFFERDVAVFERLDDSFDTIHLVADWCFLCRDILPVVSSSCRT